ncbi:MAG: hypothetical protein LBV54_05075 [Puniceicoccales bacterium]|jgi:sirohydrochlorin ferrochelatase|nr:hypothetical protein [Puniceicoccales bacterium]
MRPRPPASRQTCGTILLFSAASKRPAAHAALQALAQKASAHAGLPVEPVTPDTLDTAIERHLATGQREFRIVPLFFAPGIALTRHLPAQLETLRGKHGPFTVHTAPPLADPAADGEARIAQMLADSTQAILPGLRTPCVILVDHGSPDPLVATVRDALAERLRGALGGHVQSVRVAAMQRRPGREYDFSGPPLADILADPELADTDIALALQFLLPGRHAGPEGDIAAICAEAHHRYPRRTVCVSALLAEHPALAALVADRAAGG